MTQEEFEEYFIPPALVKYNESRVRGMATSYYRLLKGYHVNTWRAVVLEYTATETSGSRFPEPADFKRMMDDYLFNRKENAALTFSGKTYPSMAAYEEACNSPAAKKAKREFYEKLMNLYEEKGHDKEHTGAGGASHVLECIYNELVAEPYQKQKNYEKMQKEKRELRDGN